VVSSSRSYKLIQRADESLGHCKEGPRVLISSGNGANVYAAADNYKYLDFTGSSGVLGHSNDSLNQDVSRQLQRGISLPLHRYSELEAAEKTKEAIPFIDHVKFFRKEFDAVSFCFELSNYFSSDPVFVSPDDTIQSDIQSLRDKCTSHNRLLVMNESHSSFRFPKFSASNYYGIVPDLIIIGAANACGFPFFIVGGKSILMAQNPEIEEDYPVDCISLGAYTAAVTLLQKRYSIEQLWENAATFQREFNKLSTSIQLAGNYSTRLRVSGEPKNVGRFMKECLSAGFIFDDYVNFTFPLISECKSAIPILRSILLKV